LPKQIQSLVLGKPGTGYFFLSQVTYKVLTTAQNTAYTENQIATRHLRLCRHPRVPGSSGSGKVLLAGTMEFDLTQKEIPCTELQRCEMSLSMFGQQPVNGKPFLDGY